MHSGEAKTTASISPRFYHSDGDEDIDKDKKEYDNKPLLCRLYCQKSRPEARQEDAKLSFSEYNRPSVSTHFPIHVKRLKLSQ